MDWKSIGPIVGAVAPFAGKLLGGLIPFPGASFIGEQFGKIIARQFGVEPTPAAVAAGISETVATAGEETARVKINAAVEQARVEVAGFVDVEKAYLHAIEVGLAQTGETMRAEIGREHWFFNGWRPAAGWVFVFYAFVYGAILMIAGVRAAFFDVPLALERLTSGWPLYASYFAALAAMVGVYILGRSVEKSAAIANAAPMPNSKPAPPTTGGAVKPAVPSKPVPRFIPDPVGSR